MDLDGVDADEQLLGYLSIGNPSGHKFQDLSLAIGQGLAAFSHR
jgi:hypothetical protein